MTDNVLKYKSYAAALLRDPNDVEHLVNQFALLSDNGQKANYRHYISLSRRAYLLEPDNPNTAANYGHALERTGQYEEALWIYERCIPAARAAGFLPTLYHDMGVTARGLGDNARAIAYLDKAIALEPKSLYRRDKALAMMGAATMGQGSFVEGMKAFEARREYAEEKLMQTGAKTYAEKEVHEHMPPGAKHWEGEDLTGKTIVVFHEEGNGDFIQFCRFIPKLRERGAAKIILTGPVPSLLDLVADNIEIDGIVPMAGPFECDYVTGPLSLTWRLGIEYNDVSGKPYFKSSPANLYRRGELNVGIVWQGNPKYSRDHIRSMPFEAFVPLFDMPGCAFYSLQVGPGEKDVDRLGFAGFVAELSPLIKTWRDTARYITALDAVVTVDTAVAHLAGALGKPVFILHTRGADWRWHRKSDRTAWYDSARCFFQHRQDDWAPCIEEVRSRLEEMLGERRQVERANGAGRQGKRASAR